MNSACFHVRTISCKKHQEQSIRFGTYGSFDVSAQDNQLLAEERVFCHEFGLASGKVCQRPHYERSGGRFGPVYEVVVKRLKAKACQPFDEDEESYAQCTLPLLKMSR